MKLTSGLGALFLAAAAAALTPSAPVSAAERGPAPRAKPAERIDIGRVIVKFKARAKILQVQGAQGTDVLPQRAHVLASRLGLSLADGRAMGERTQLMTAAGIASTELAERIAADSEVEWAVADQRRFIARVPNDSLYATGQTGSIPEVGQWYLRAPDTTAVSAINATAAWDRSTGSAGVVVAVIDTGVRRDHPDLAGKLLAGYDFISADGDGSYDTSNDGNGRDSDPSDPGDWITAAEAGQGNFSGCSASDSSWHGTQTAGLIGAATNNGQGMAGSGWSTKILPLRALGKCGGYDSDIVDAMRWAAGLTVPGLPVNANPAKVVNMSLGSEGACTAAYSSAVTELAARGVVVVAAAGNEGRAVNVPGNCAGAIAVAGVRHTGTKVGYSSLGTQVTVSAPAGNCVNLVGDCLYPLLTTTNTGTRAPAGSSYSDSVNPSLGTSFAAPLVSGTAALMFAVNGSATPSAIAGFLKSSARAFPTTGADSGTPVCRAPSTVAQDEECYCTTTTCGAGMLDASAAVAAAAGAVVPTAVIGAPSATPQAGASFTVDGSGSTAGGGETVSSYRWVITSGSTVARISGSATGSTVTIAALAAGSFTLQLTITDSAGGSDSETRTVTVAAAPSSGGGGGGATEPAWAAGLLLALGALAWRRRCARQQPTRLPRR
jgi:serine protease